MPATGRAPEAKDHTIAEHDTSRSQSVFSSSYITPGQRSPKQTSQKSSYREEFDEYNGVLTRHSKDSFQS